VALVIWIICAIGCGILADKKGRNVPLAVVLGILFGVIPLIVYACMSHAKKCPNCKEGVNPEANVCKHCRSEI
jgi:hypothetical protein